MSFLNAHHFNIHDSTFNDIQGDQNNYNLIQDDGEPGFAILRQVIASGAPHDSAERYPAPNCHPDTREAVLDRILYWVANTGTEDSEGSEDSEDSEEKLKPNVLWLYGPAGAGKSAIAQTVAERCGRDGRLAASFFFSRGKPGRSTGKHLFPTIAYQLAISEPKIREPLGKLIQQDPTILYKSMEIQLQKLIVEPYQTLSLEDLSSRLVIIDGLDECDGNDVQCHILSLLGASDMNRLSLRFFIASRPEPHIRGTFNNRYFKRISRRIALNHFFADNDIRTFLRSRFADIHERHRHVMTSVSKRWPSDHVIELLVQKSSGQFIYASTVLKFIDYEYSRPTERLQMVLGVSGSTSTAFADLDMLYKQILSTNPDTSRLLRVLGTILLISPSSKLRHDTSDPPSSELIESVLFLEPGDVGLILRGLHSLIDIPDPGADAMSPIRFHHASLSDFLQDPARSGAYFIDAGVHHSHLAQCCLTTITRWSKSRFPDIFKSEHSRAVNYSLREWSHHCMQSVSHDELMNDLRNFNLYTFFEAAANAGMQVDFFTSLHAVIQWLRVTPDLFQRFCAVLDDLYRRELAKISNTSHLLSILRTILLLSPSSQSLCCSSFSSPGWSPPSLPSQLQCFPSNLPSSGFIGRVLFLKLQDIDLTLRGLSSLIDISSPGVSTVPTIRFHHASFSDFLQDPTRSGEFFIDISAHHSHLARCCLRTITEWSECGFPSILFNSEHYQAVEYSSRNWPYHCTRSVPHDELLDDLRNFNLSLWFEAVANAGLLVDLFTSLDAVIQWLRGTPDLFQRFRTVIDNFYHRELSAISNTTHLLCVLRTILLLLPSSQLRFYPSHLPSRKRLPLRPPNHWLSYPLNLPSSGLIEKVLFLEDGNVSSALHRIYSLVIPGSVTSPCFFRHASFSSFLQDPARSGIFFIDADTHHAHLARCCLRTITEWSESEFPDVFKSEHYHAVEYSLKEWSYHCIQSVPRDELLNDLQNFNLHVFFEVAANAGVLADFFTSLNAVVQWLQGTPDLHQRFRTVLDDLYQRELSRSPSTSRLLHILGIIIALYEPLPFFEMEHLIAIEHDDVFVALQGLDSILHIPPITDLCSPVCIRHASLADFLNDPARSGRFFIDVAAYHAHLACGCLKILEEGPPRASGYALRYWATHLSQSTPYEELFYVLQGLCPRHCSDWELTTVIRWLQNISNNPSGLGMQFQEEHDRRKMSLV